MSTRLIGALIMAHGDDEGLVLPPRVAPEVAAVVPIFRSPEEEAKVRAYAEKIVTALGGPGSLGARARADRHGVERHVFNPYTHQGIAVDFRDLRPGEKHFEWEQRGVPFRIEVGPRDVDAGTFVLKGRVDGSKVAVPFAEVSKAWFEGKLNQAHDLLFAKAQKFRDEHTHRANTYDELKKLVSEGSGFVRCYFEPDRESEKRIKTDTKATVRCVPFDQPKVPGTDVYTGKPTSTEVIFAVAY